MAWLDQCDVCGGGGFFCCHRNPDLNQAAAACPHGGGSPGVLREFQFFGREDGGVAWLLNGGAKASEGELEDRTAVAPLPAVAPAMWENADWRGDTCSPRWPTLDGCPFPASLPEPAPKSPLVDPSVVGPDAAVGATMPVFSGGADASYNSDAAGEADRATSSGKDDGGGSSSMDREARVLRYREKKKRRKFGKQIRYASRKAYAETRPRVRGRFAKAPDAAPPPPPMPPGYRSEQIDMGWFRAFRP